MLTRSLGARLGKLAWGLSVGALVAGACAKNDDIKPQGKPGLEGSGGSGLGARGGGGGKSGNAGEGGDDAGGAAGTTDTGGTSGTGGGGGTATNVPGAPVVHITSPNAVSKPNDTGVIVTADVDVLCTVTKSKDKGADDVASVTLEMLDGDGKVVDSRPGTKTDNDDEYTANFLTGKVEANGRITFSCYGNDGSTPPLTGADQIDSFIDHGPAILPSEPPGAGLNMPKYATSLKEPLQVAFEVKEAPLATKGDNGARIGDVSLSVAGKAFKLAEKNGTYTATINLNDPKIFNPAPTGDQKILITASDQRAPDAGTNTVAYNFTVDSTGPEISIVAPADSDVTTGTIPIRFTVTDVEAGVDPFSVQVTIDKKTYTYNEDALSSWVLDAASGTYTFSFDTRQVDPTTSTTTISVKAQDRAGNKSSAAGINIFFDNVAPYVDLDPLPVREENKMTSHCSLAFDPVGPAAPNDLDVVQDFVGFRVLAWEDTNHIPGAKAGLAAGIDLDSIDIFLQPNPEHGLLKDLSHDGVCDAIEPADPKDADEITPFPLKAINPQGSSWFGSFENEQDSPLAQIFPMPAGCGYENSPTAPIQLCPPQNDSDMTRVISWDIKHTVPVIFGFGPLDPFCTGFGWGIKSLVASEGWICVAASAKDNNGNVGISPPLRLCYDDGVDPPPNCTGDNPVPPPSCVVDDCQVPPHFGLSVLSF